MATAEGKKIPIHEFKLEVDHELRFEVSSKNEKVFLTLKSGRAEVSGNELDKDKPYEFGSGAKVAVFTWHGCTLEICGKIDVSDITKDTPMVAYSNCHAALELMRIDAEKENKNGPTAIIVGTSDVDKSTIVRILLNYAVRMGRSPIFVDLDVGQGQICIPGKIGALRIEKPTAIDEGFSQEALLVYDYGHKTPQANTARYNMLITQLANDFKEQLVVNKKTRASGVIVNTCGWIEGEGYQLILHAMGAFEVDVVLVLDQERLYNALVQDLPNFCKIVFLQKSGGV